ncbi:MAG TPA: NACHT domain-containing protein [Polyangiaceae bacterium]
MLSQLERLAVAEDWRDDRFAELEAEVEVHQGRERIISWLRFSPYRNVTLRREKSLSAGLARTTDSLVILEGEPGSGKSVALRHLAEQLARKAQNSDSGASLIPLYVNLKEFRPAQRPVDADAVHDFIVEALTRAHDRNADQFIHDEFDRGMLEGTWLLLLDSFDEIPDVLSSTESDNTVAEYALAVKDFLTGMRKGRAVVASREFRGPQTFNVPRFRIVNLTVEQQADLIRKSGLRPAAQAAVHAGLADTDPELRQLARNPMFLGLVCEYVRSRGTFPPSSHAAYDSFLDQRLTRDGDRLRKRYSVGPDEVRLVAQETAFCMTATEGLGLSPARADLRVALASDGRISLRLFDKVLDALEYTKLGRAADDPAGGGIPHFTFAHRRFQEYFATRVVLRAPDRVSVHELLTNGRWRETAVTILQTQPAEATAPLLAEAALLLAPIASEATGEHPDNPDAVGFPWPRGSLHLLQLLDAGLGRVPGNLGDEIRRDCARLLRAAWDGGRRHDQKWAVSVALTADQDTTIWLATQAFASGSVYLGGAAYTVVSRMADPPESLYAGVCQTLTDIAASGQFAAERITLRAQVSRLPDPQSLPRVLRLLAAAPAIDIWLAVIVAAADLAVNPWALLANAIFLPPSILGFGINISRRKTINPELYLMTFCARLLACTVPVIVFINENSIASIFGLVAGFYFVTWPWSVAHSARHGCVPHAYAWPALPVATFVHLLSRIKFTKVTVWAMISGVVFLALYVLALAELGSWMNSSASAAEIVAGFGLVAAAVTAAAAPAASIRYVQMRRADARTLRTLAENTGALDAQRLLAALRAARTRRGALRILRWVCRSDDARSADVLRALSDLALLTTAGSPKEMMTMTGIGNDVREWLQVSDKRSRHAIRAGGEEIHDMIALAIEQAELERQRENAVRLPRATRHKRDGASWLAPARPRPLCRGGDPLSRLRRPGELKGGSRSQAPSFGITTLMP